jgi:hypothetical protein
MANVDQGQMWAQFMQAMQQNLFPNGVDEGSMFSAGSVARSINLNATDPGITNYGIYSLADIIPANSPSYTPLPSGLAATYMQFLSWIDLGGDTNPNLRSQLNIALNGDGGANPGLIAIQAGYNNTYTAAANAYNTFKATATSIGDPVPAFKDWFPTNYPMLATAQSQLDGAQSKVDQLSNQLYGPGYQQVQLARQICGINRGAQDPMQPNNFNMQITSATYIPPGSTAVVIGQAAPAATSPTTVSSYVPLYVLDTAYAATYGEWQAASVAGQIGTTFEFSSQGGDYDYKSSGWNASAHASWSSFLRSVSGSVSGGSATSEFDLTSSDYHIKVSFVGFKAFSITPGPWWQNGSLVSTYRNKLKPNAPDFFGDNGAMARRVSQVVLGFEPTIEITLSASDYKSLKTAWKTEASLSVGIGPFSFGSSGDANGSTDQIHYDDAKSSIKIGPVKSIMPVLLGVVSSKL